MHSTEKNQYFPFSQWPSHNSHEKQEDWKKSVLKYSLVIKEDFCLNISVNCQTFPKEEIKGTCCYVKSAPKLEKNSALSIQLARKKAKQTLVYRSNLVQNIYFCK
jgi:hypothetical protein